MWNCSRTYSLFSDFDTKLTYVDEDISEEFQHLLHDNFLFIDLAPEVGSGQELIYDIYINIHSRVKSLWLLLFQLSHYTCLLDCFCRGSFSLLIPFFPSFLS